MQQNGGYALANFVEVTHLETILSFLDTIGIVVMERTIGEETFLPGILIDHGVLVIDREKLLYPGDLLHEAGHLAVVTPAERKLLYNTVTADKSRQHLEAMEEMSAIAWSYAAVCHIGIPIEVLFHPAGYKGGSDSLIDNFSNGKYLGVPGLAWLGLCNYQKMQHSSYKPYPHMIKWIRD